MRTIESMIQEWDGEEVIVRYDQPTGAWVLIAIHSSVLGPATGGTRMKPYPSFAAAMEDVLKLSAGMTCKFAVPGFARGGGKAVIFTHRELNPTERTGLLHRYGKLIHQLGGTYLTGPDIGTTPEDMDIIAETGAPYIHSRTPAAGGAGSSGPFTALGVYAGIQVVCQQLFGEPSPRGRRVLVQGAGSVGGKLIELLSRDSAEVLFSEVDGALALRIREVYEAEFVPGDTVHTTPCDVFSPCALGGVLNSETIPQLKCRGIAGGANNQLAEPEDAARLAARGILYAPDYVVSIGGAMGITGMEAMGWSHAQAEEQVTESVRSALTRIFTMAAVEKITTEAAARRIAEERLSSRRQ
jgi:leucine dehydrogenase